MHKCVQRKELRKPLIGYVERTPQVQQITGQKMNAQKLPLFNVKNTLKGNITFLLANMTYTTPPSEWKKRQEKLPSLSPIFFLFTVLLFILLVVPLNTAHYSRNEMYRENNGCAYSDCLPALQKEIVLAHNGLLPPSQYERNTWEWVRSTCTYSPQLCG